MTEVYKRLIYEVKILEDELVLMKEKKEDAESDYKFIKDKVNNLEDELDKLSYQCDNMPRSNYGNISIFLGILSTITLLLSLLLNGYLSIKIGFYLKSLFLLNTTEVVLISIILIVLGIVTIGAVELKLFKKLETCLENKSYEKIINSKEYKKLLVERECKEHKLDEVLDEELSKKIIMRDIVSKYNNQVAEISVKKGLINYLQSNMNSNIELEERKNYVRKKVNK